VSIMDRIKMNIRANLNYALDKAEDPQKVLDQMLLDMKQGIQEFKGSIAEAIVGVKKLEREVTENTDKAKLWEERALLALKKDNEELAKKAIDQKLTYLDNESRAKKQLAEQKQMVEELKSSLPVLETKLSELSSKKTDLIKKSLQMSASQNVRSMDTVSEIGIDSMVFNTYDSIVDKIMTLEDHVDALAELSEKDEVEAEFRKMEKQSKIDSELSKVKENLKDETETG